MMESRRDFLKKTGILLGGAAILGVTGCSAEKALAETKPHDGHQRSLHDGLCCYPGHQRDHLRNDEGYG